MSGWERRLLSRVPERPRAPALIAAATLTAIHAHQRALGMAGGALTLGRSDKHDLALIAEALDDTPLLAIGDLAPDALPSTATFWRTTSRQVTAAAVEAALGGKARCCHIGRAARALAIAQDLALAEAVLAPDGVLALDGFCNPWTLGVAEAAHGRFASGTGLRPFALAGGTLFLAASPHTSVLRDVVTRFLEISELPPAAAYRAVRALDRATIEPELWGARLVAA